MLLGIVRGNGTYVGAPKGPTEVRAGDTLVLYGKAELLSELDLRPSGASGDAAHEKAKDRQQHLKRQEEAEDQ